MLNQVVDALQDKYLYPDWSNSALITVDTQRDFSLDGAVAQIPGTMDIVNKIGDLLREYRKVGLPIFHVVRLYLADGSNVDICRRSLVESGARIAVPDTDGSQLVTELLPRPETKLDAAVLLNGDLQEIAPKEWVLYKSRFGAFYQTKLHLSLQYLGVNTLVFSGCNFPNCPRTSIYEATERDYRIVLARDSISGLYEKGIEEMRNIGINIMNSNDITGYLNNQ